MTQKQKEKLQQLIKHPAFEVMQEIVEEKRLSLLSQFELANLWDEETAKKLNNTQNYLQGLKYFVDTIKGQSQTIKKAPKMK